jgi:hypothetical protein
VISREVSSKRTSENVYFNIIYALSWGQSQKQSLRNKSWGDLTWTNLDVTTSFSKGLSNTSLNVPILWWAMLIETKEDGGIKQKKVRKYVCNPKIPKSDARSMVEDGIILTGLNECTRIYFLWVK